MNVWCAQAPHDDAALQGMRECGSIGFDFQYVVDTQLPTGDRVLWLRGMSRTRMYHRMATTKIVKAMIVVRMKSSILAFLRHFRLIKLPEAAATDVEEQLSSGSSAHLCTWKHRGHSLVSV